MSNVDALGTSHARIRVRFEIAPANLPEYLRAAGVNLLANSDQFDICFKTVALWNAAIRARRAIVAEWIAFLLSYVTLRSPVGMTMGRRRRCQN